MDNTVAWGNNSEVGEGRFAPLEEGEPLLVSVELNLLILVFSVGSAGNINLDGVVNNEVSLAKWVDLAWVTSKLLHGSAHRGQINHSWDTGKVLK